MFRVMTIMFRVITIMFRAITIIFRVITIMLRVITIKFICDYGIQIGKCWSLVGNTGNLLVPS